jgi:hypothetical protein
MLPGKSPMSKPDDRSYWERARSANVAGVYIAAIQKKFEKMKVHGWACLHCGEHGKPPKQFRLVISRDPTKDSYIMCLACSHLQEFDFERDLGL